MAEVTRILRREHRLRSADDFTIRNQADFLATLGARRAIILMQFLIEAVVLCLVGGTIGVALGAGVAAFLRTSLHWSTSVGFGSVLMAFGFAAAVGVIFGVWPARRASLLDPIEALRTE